MAERYILLSCEANESFFEQEYFKRVAAEYQDVQSNIELQLVHQEWVLQILLDDIGLLLGNLVRIISKEDASSLAEAIRFNDKRERGNSRLAR